MKATDEQIASVRDCVVAGEDGPSITEMGQHCADAGYGDKPLSDEYDSTPVVVNGLLMPRWMAEVMGHVHKRRLAGEGE